MPKKVGHSEIEPIESRLKKVDRIVQRLGEGEATLDEARKLYAEGMEIVKVCRKELKESRGHIEKLNRETGKLEPFEPPDTE